MKFAVVILAFVAAASAQFSNGQYNGFNNNGQYNPFNAFNNRYNNRYNPYTTPQPFRYRPVPTTVAPIPFIASTPAPTPISVQYAAKVASSDYNAETVRYGNEVSPDGAYNYFYETNNGIAAQEQGTPRVFSGNPPVAPVVKQGSFSYTSPEGVPVAISYVADENGYQPSGDVLPTPPPVPALIARALEYLARNAPAQK